MPTLTLTPADLQIGDRILGWTGLDPTPVDVRDDRADDWTVDGVIVRPEDAPSYRRHRHGEVQVTFRDARIDYPEGAEILAWRPA